jgi:lysyl-tRNA synthetase class I
VLDSMYHGRPLTVMSQVYLLEQKLTGLHQLATGQITYDTYLVAASAAQQERKQAAEAERQAKETERLAKEAERLAKEAEWERKYKLECKAAEAARIARESDPKYIAKKKSQALRDKYGIG